MVPAPGWIFIASTICTGIIVALSHEAFAAYAWVPVALTVLAAIVKALAALTVSPTSRSLNARAPAPWVRFWFGG